MRLIKKTPLAVSGVALALASLGNLLRSYEDTPWIMCGALSAAIMLLFALRLLLDFERVSEELKNPVVHSTLPTSTMAVMLLGVYLMPFAGLAAPQPEPAGARS